MSRLVLGGAAVALCLCGAIRLAEGAAVPIRAEIAQYRLRQVFEQRLDAALPVPAAPAATPGSLPPMPSPAAAQTMSALPTAGPVARITVPRLGVRDIVLAGNGTHDQLAEGPTMIRQGDAASPVTILAAHRDTHFLFLRDLREGDEIRLQFVNGRAQRYRVTRFETVGWDRFTYPLHLAHPRLALTTCYPFGGTEYGGPWRRVVWAERVQDRVRRPQPLAAKEVEEGAERRRDKAAAGII